MIKNKIRIFDLTFDEQFRKKFSEGSKKILDEGFLANHSYVKKFEKEFSKKVGSKFAVAVNNGTSAIEVPLRALNLNGKDVLLGTNTFIATAIAIKNAGGNPIPIDIEDEYYSLCPKRLEASITNKTAAVILIHIGGLVTPHTKKIQELCKLNNIHLIEDCAQAFGSTLDNVHVGNFGKAGCFSFQTTKVMTTGEGGMVITNDEKYYNDLISARQYGYDFHNPLMHINSGSNFKMSEFVALLGICELDRVDKRMNKRRLLGERYQDNLSGKTWETLSPAPGSTSGYYKQIIISPISRKIIAKKLSDANIALTGGVYFIPIHRQPNYNQNFNDMDYPVANRFSENHFCPPCYPELSIEDIDYVCKTLLSIKN